MGADALKLLTVYSDHVPSRGHQCNGQKREVCDEGRQVEDNKGMKQCERDKKRIEEKKQFSSKWKKDH